MTEQTPNPDDQTPITGQEPASGAKEDHPSEIVFTHEQQKLIDKRIAQAKRDAKAAADAEIERKQGEEAAERERQKQIAAGEFESVKKSLEEERDGFKATATTAQEKLDALITAIKPDIDAAWKDIPDEIKSFYDGGDDDVLAKRAFLAKSKPALDKFTAQQNEQNDRFRKVPTTPRPNGTTSQELPPLVPAKF